MIFVPGSDPEDAIGPAFFCLMVEERRAALLNQEVKVDRISLAIEVLEELWPDRITAVYDYFEKYIDD